MFRPLVLTPVLNGVVCLLLLFIVHVLEMDRHGQTRLTISCTGGRSMFEITCVLTLLGVGRSAAKETKFMETF